MLGYLHVYHISLNLISLALQLRGPTQEKLSSFNLLQSPCGWLFIHLCPIVEYLHQVCKCALESYPIGGPAGTNQHRSIPPNRTQDWQQHQHGLHRSAYLFSHWNFRKLGWPWWLGQMTFIATIFILLYIWSSLKLPRSQRNRNDVISWEAKDRRDLCEVTLLVPAGTGLLASMCTAPPVWRPCAPAQLPALLFLQASPCFSSFLYFPSAALLWRLLLDEL